jgi:hypothetical protein
MRVFQVYKAALVLLLTLAFVSKTVEAVDNEVSDLGLSLGLRLGLL